MTLEQQESLRRELDGAMASGDDARIRCAQSNILLALMDCQRKTSDRVKKLTWKLFAILSGAGGVVGFGIDKLDLIKLLFNN